MKIRPPWHRQLALFAMGVVLVVVFIGIKRLSARNDYVCIDTTYLYLTVKTRWNIDTESARMFAEATPDDIGETCDISDDPDEQKRCRRELSSGKSLWRVKATVAADCTRGFFWVVEHSPDVMQLTPSAVVQARLGLKSTASWERGGSTCASYWVRILCPELSKNLTINQKI